MLTLPFLMAATVGAVLFVGVAGALRAGQHLTRLYLARDTNEMLFREELDAIATERGARVHHLLGADRSCLSADSLTRLVPALRERDVYLCGPPSMAVAVRSALRTAGLPPDHLHEERFGS